MIDKIYNHPGGKLRRLGARSLNNRELLAIVINSGTKNSSALEIADKLYDKVGCSLRGFFGRSLSDIMEIEGIGSTKATQLAAVFELARRIIQENERD